MSAPAIVPPAIEGTPAAANACAAHSGSGELQKKCGAIHAAATPAANPSHRPSCTESRRSIRLTSASFMSIRCDPLISTRLPGRSSKIRPLMRCPYVGHVDALARLDGAVCNQLLERSCRRLRQNGRGNHQEKNARTDALPYRHDCLLRLHSGMCEAVRIRLTVGSSACVPWVSAGCGRALQPRASVTTSYRP
jgi:hypothetical protein